jgi:hypothetical protein
MAGNKLADGSGDSKWAKFYDSVGSLWRQNKYTSLK